MDYSFVIPCYRSEYTIEGVVEELLVELDKEGIRDFEIVLVNDCSPDNVWKVIKDLAKKNSRIRGICMAKNFGQQAALLAGYAKCNGEIVISLDDDGQAPIDELYKLIDEIKQGYDVVFAQYREIKQSLFRRFGSKVNTWMVKTMIDSPKGIYANSFLAMRKFVVREIVHYDKPYPYLPGLIYRSTWNISNVMTNHRNRIQGGSGYNFRKLLALWINGLTTFSIKPLEAGVWLGLFFCLFGFGGAVFTIIRKLCNPNVMSGWSSLISIILFVSGLVLLMLGVIGEYIGRIYICINKLPQYVVKEDTYID